MMNLSNVIKKTTSSSGILTTKQFVDESEKMGFQSLDSLWEAGDDQLDYFALLKKQQEQLRQEAEELISQAEAKVASIQKEAYDKGYARGKEKALAEEQKSLSLKMKQFDTLMRAVEAEQQKLADHYENDLLELLKMLVEKITNHEVSVNPLVIQATLKKALSYVIENTSVQVNLNSNDFLRIKEAGMENPELLGGLNQLELIDAQNVKEGGCILETEFGEVDATLESRREQLFEAIDKIFLKSLSRG